MFKENIDSVWSEEFQGRSKAAEQAVGTLPSISNQVMPKLQKIDNVISRIISFRETGKPSKWQIMKETKGFRQLIHDWERIEEKDGIFSRVIQADGQKINQLPLPECLHGRILEMTQDQLIHRFARKTLSLARTRCFWP